MHILEETKQEQQKNNLKERHEKYFITINPGGQDFFSSFIININVEYGITYMEVTPMHFAHYFFFLKLFIFHTNTFVTVEISLSLFTYSKEKDLSVIFRMQQ